MTNLTTWLRSPALVVAITSMSAGCSVVTPRHRLADAGPVRVSHTSVVLHGTPLDLHLAVSPAAVPSDLLIMYASGDGGWFGAAVDMFRSIASHGYATVGFSSRAFLKIERLPNTPLNATQLAADYALILAEARSAFGLAADTPAILTGWSRGAAFAAIAGSEPLLRDQLRGVIAIGLSDGEDLDGGADETDDGSSQPSRLWPFQPYARLRHVEPLRCAVIQATHDNYLPAARARELFGSDTPYRRFYLVEARNHRFSGGHAEFTAALVSALSWTTDAGPAPK